MAFKKEKHYLLFVSIHLCQFILTTALFALPQSSLAAEPLVSTPTLSRSPVSVDTTITISVTADDPDLQDLTYDWTAVSGSITGSGNQVSYQAPASMPVAGVDTVTVDVSDGENIVTQSIIVPLQSQNEAVDLYFSPDKGIFYVGEETPVKVMLHAPSGLTIGRVDLQIPYNPRLIKLLDTDEIASGLQITPSSNISNVIENLSPETATAGTIKFSADLNKQSDASTDLLVATIYFEPQQVADYFTLEFASTPFNTQDTNVFLQGRHRKDSLKEARLGEYRIKKERFHPAPVAPAVTETPPLEPSGLPTNVIILLATFSAIISLVIISKSYQSQSHSKK